MHGSSSKTETLRFGRFELNVRSREVRNGTTTIRLQEQPFEILRAMLERPGDVVTREELCARLWPDGTFVDFEHGLNAAMKRLRAALGDDAVNPRYIETLPRRGYRLIADAAEPSAAPTPAHGGSQRVRLAVLPFTYLGDDGAQEYFSDGLTEETIAQLGQRCRGRIGVIARSSSMAFKDTAERARAIGEALGADYLLEGSVRREGDRIRIIARLIEASDETQLWAETYERHVTDHLSLQADVAARLARSLAMELAPEASTRQQGAAPSAAAYHEYLKGRYHWNKLDDERETASASALEAALACFERALTFDPRFAEAHAIAARTHIARAQQYLERPRVALEKARTCAKRAVELEPTVAEGHLAFGDIRRMLEWDWRGAEAAYLQAIALNPSQENAHRRYSLMLAARARHAEAIHEAERACELDPLSVVGLVSAALVRYLARDFEAAIDRCRSALELSARYMPARRLLAAAALQAGRTAAALEALEAAYSQVEHAPIALAWLAHARAAAGDCAGGQECIDRWHRMDRSRYLPPYHLAIAHVGLGQTDDAFTALELACVDADPALAFVTVDPRFDPIRSDGRYSRLVELIGLGGPSNTS